RFDVGIENRHHDFDAAMEVARHPVGARDEYLVLPAVLETGHPRVFEETVDQSANANSLTHPRHVRPEAADAANEERDGHARLGGAVKRFDDVAVDQSVELADDPRRSARSRVL